MTRRGWKCRQRRPLRQLTSQRQGAAVAEFAMILPIFMLMVMGIMDFGMTLFVNATLEGAVRDASRYGVTGQDGGDRLQVIRDIIADRTVGLVDIDVADIRTRIYESFEDIGYTEPLIGDPPPEGEEMVPGVHYDDLNSNGEWDEDLGQEGVGGPDEIVLYTINYELPMISGLVKHVMGGDAVSLSTSIAVKNEPFYSYE